MPNTSNDDVIIVGSLSDKELRDSIDKLVDYVGDKTTIMAGRFDVAMEKMKSAMKDFAITQKVSVDLMQDAWKQMSASFDAMLKAQQNATSSGNNSGTGGGNSQYADNTVGHLQEIIALEEKRRKEMTLGSDALRDQNKLIEEQKAKLKGETTSDQVKVAQAAKKELQEAFTMPARGLADAEKKLQQLQSLSAKFQGKGILDQTQWNRLNAQIQTTQEKIDKLRQKKPTSIQDVLGMDESSVDAIAKKMAALKKVTVDPQNTAQVKQLGDEYQRLSKLQTSLLGKNAQVIRSNNYLAQSFGYIRNRLVYALTLGAISNFTKELYQIRGQYELLERSLGVLLDDMGKGSQIFRELNAMSLKSPFTLIDLAGAAKQLTAYNFAADEVVDTTRRLADISAALGVPMERLVYNLGQIRAQNVLNARDARDFANAGLPIVSMLADMYTEQKRFGDEMVTTANVYDMMSKKMVSYADVLQVINKVTDEGGKFFDFQAKQADTLQVQMANLNLAYNNMLNSIGKENQGVLAGGLSIVKDLLLNWRQVYRVLMTLITTYGAYRTAVALVGWEHKRTFGARMLISIQQWVNGIKNAKTAMQALNAAMSSNVLGLFVSALAAAVSYFWLFNNSADEMKEKLKEIQETFTSMRSNATDIFVNGLKSDNVNTQIDKLKELVSFAESELGITIPVNIQDVDAENVAQKLRDAKNYIDEYLDFAQAFSETAAGNKYLNEYFTEFGNTAQSTFTNIYSSVNTVIEGLQKLADEGRASARDLEILEELVTGKKEDESKLEYLQRLVSLYEELGLIGRKVVTPVTPVISYTHSTEDNMEFLEEQQKKTLDRIKVHNKQVFATMLQDVQDFYSNANIAEYQLERTVKELAERIDINSIPEDQRTLKLSAAINEEASKNNWNDFAKQYARQVANTKFGTTIEISDESKKNTEVELKEWQKKLQSWADANGIALGITLNFNTTEVDAANEALQNVKKAQELLAVQQRKLKVGTATQADVDAAEKALKNARLVATQAGADLASLNRKGSRGGSKKDDVLDVLKDEISLVKKLQSEYDKLTKSGVKSADAIVAMQDAYGSTLRLLNKDLQKFGLPRIELSNILGKNPHEILAVFTELRNILESKGLSNLERMKAVEGVIEELKVSAKTYDMKKVTDGLNSELGKIKDEYELAIELDANPELGNMFADMFGIDTDGLTHSIDEYMLRVYREFDKWRGLYGGVWSFDIFKADEKTWKEWGDAIGVTGDELDKLKKPFVEAQNVVKKWAQDTVKQTQDLRYKLADNEGKIAIKLKERNELNKKFNEETNEQQKELYRLQLQDLDNYIDELRTGLLSEIPEYARVFNSVAEHSDYMTRKLISDLKKIYDYAKAHPNADGTYTITGSNGKQTILSRKEFDKRYRELEKEERKSQKPFAKIKEAFSKGSDGVVDYAKGIELVSAEVQKLESVASEVGNLAQIFGADEQTVEIINDVATSLNGVATAGQGISQIASGDYIGGAASVLSGITSVIGAWADNGNKRIDAEIKNSERAVKRLELAYKNLEFAIDEAYGANVAGAKQAAIANKELQLAELQRQLALEKSRDSKHRDEERIIELQGQIIDLKNDIKKSSQEIATDLLGISGVADEAMTLMDAYIDALRKGEDAQKAFSGSFKEMILNMLKQIWVTKVIGPELESLVDDLNERLKNRSETEAKAYEKAVEEQSRRETMSDDDIRESIAKQRLEAWKNDPSVMKELSKMSGLERNVVLSTMYQDFLLKVTQDEIDSYRKEAEIATNEAKKALNKATVPTIEDLDLLAQSGLELLPKLESMDDVFNAMLERYDLFDKDSSSNLSALQQGIQGVTEDTAGAIEAYMNIVSQRVFEQNLYLQEIRDHLNNFDLDVQLGTLSQMLLQLQQSYQVQQNIESILTGVLNPSGRAIVVELNS